MKRNMLILLVLIILIFFEIFIVFKDIFGAWILSTQNILLLFKYWLIVCIVTISIYFYLVKIELTLIRCFFYGFLISFGSSILVWFYLLIGVIV